MEIFNKTLTQAEQHKIRVSLGIILHTHSLSTFSSQGKPCFYTTKHGASCTGLPGTADLQQPLQPPQAGSFLPCKAHGDSRHWKGLEHSLFGWIFPGFLNGHVLPEPTDTKVDVFRRQHLQLEVFVVQKGKPKHSCLSVRKHGCVWGCAPQTAVRTAAPHHWQ